MATHVSPGETAARRRDTLADLFVVDADVHAHEDPAQLAEVIRIMGSDTASQ